MWRFLRRCVDSLKQQEKGGEERTSGEAFHLRMSVNVETNRLHKVPMIGPALKSMQSRALRGRFCWKVAPVRIESAVVRGYSSRIHAGPLADYGRIPVQIKICHRRKGT